MPGIENKYKLIKLPSYYGNNFTTLDFDNAHSLAVYLWGKDLTRYAVYKENHLVTGITSHVEIYEMQKYLEGF